MQFVDISSLGVAYDFVVNIIKKNCRRVRKRLGPKINHKKRIINSTLTLITKDITKITNLETANKILM